MARTPQIPNRSQQPKKQVVKLDSKTVKIFEQGFISHQRGQLVQAKAAYEQVLEKQPKHFDALHLLGVIASQSQDHALAEELIGKAIEINPFSASAHSNHGTALKELKRLDDALASYDKAIALKPDYADAFYNRGVALKELKRLDDAIASYDKAIVFKPDYAEAFNNRGTALKELRRSHDALASYDKAIDLNPNYAEAFNNRGTALKDLKHLDAALESYVKAITLKPNYADAFYNLGIALKELKRLADALASYDKAIALKPDYAEAFYNRGIALQEFKRLDDALASYDKAIALKPDFAEALHNRGNLLQELKCLDDALDSYDKAIALNPDHADAFYNRGIALQEFKRLDDAVASYDKAIALIPDHAEAFNNRGTALQQLKRLDDALASYDKAIAFKPDYADGYNNRGTAQQELKRPDDALASYDKAIALIPDFAEAFNNRGTALKELKRLDDALESYDKAISLKPDYAEAFNNLGNALQELKRLDDALASYDKAIDLNPNYAEAYNNRGTALKELKRLDDALASYDKAITLKPDFEFLLGTKLHTQMRICDWSDLQNQLNVLTTSIEEGLKITPSFPLLALKDRPELQLQASKIYANEKYIESRIWGDFNTRPADGKIRIGYYSADFHNHATSFLMAELFEAHDAQRFELYGFSFGPDKQDEMRSRVSSGFNHFFDVTKKSDHEVARMSRELGIDIAVDLKGFTQDCRTGIFAEHCAPIQINYLGYPGTLAASYFDYIVADKTLIPQESQKYYSEKIIYLPYSYQVNDSKRKISPKVFTRRELGLPESGFVFCCFNNNYKILPAMFDIWMRLLKTVNGSVLWLLQDNPTVAKNLCIEAELRGVDPSRLVFAPRMKLEEHLARHRFADLFIDTLPCNAHTTASDALWAGLPVLTQMGQSFAARVAASLLNAMDLPELITKTQEEYEARAIELANDSLQLTEIKTRLEQNRETSPLFNGQLFARHIEAAYTEIHRRYIHGEKPDHIHIKAMI